MTFSPRQRTDGRWHRSVFAAGPLRLSVSAGRQAAPQPRDPGIPLSLTLFLTWDLSCSGCILEPVCLLCVPPVSPIHSGTLGRRQLPGLLPGRPALGSLPETGWLLSTWQLRVPALHLLWPRASTAPAWTVNALASAQGCREAVGRLPAPSAPPHPKVFCLLCSVVGRSLGLARKLDSHIFG